MESNGKRWTATASRVDYGTGPIIWGEPGTNGQHAFYQLIHQGTRIIPCDFLAAGRDAQPARRAPPDPALQLLRADRSADARQDAPTRSAPSCKGQELVGGGAGSAGAAQGVRGQPADQLDPVRRSSTPRTLGTLIAMYEHKIFVQGIIWDINSFDQWGVELGKQLAKVILPELEGRSGRVTATTPRPTA